MTLRSHTFRLSVIVALFLLTLVGASSAFAAPDGQCLPNAPTCYPVPDPDTPPDNNGGGDGEEPPSEPDPSDLDGDRIPVPLDQCPQRGGPSNNEGCPPGVNPDADNQSGDLEDISTDQIDLPTLPQDEGCLLATAGRFRVNARSAPRENDTEIIGSLAPTDVYAGTGRSDGWTFVDAPGDVQGWVSDTVTRRSLDCTDIEPEPTTRICVQFTSQLYEAVDDTTLAGQIVVYEGFVGNERGDILAESPIQRITVSNTYSTVLAFKELFEVPEASDETGIDYHKLGARLETGPLGYNTFTSVYHVPVEDCLPGVLRQAQLNPSEICVEYTNTFTNYNDASDPVGGRSTVSIALGYRSSGTPVYETPELRATYEEEGVAVVESYRTMRDNSTPLNSFENFIRGATVQPDPATDAVLTQVPMSNCTRDL